MLTIHYSAMLFENREMNPRLYCHPDAIVVSFPSDHLHHSRQINSVQRMLRFMMRLIRPADVCQPSSQIHFHF